MLENTLAYALFTQNNQASEFLNVFVLKFDQIHVTTRWCVQILSDELQPVLILIRLRILLRHILFTLNDTLTYLSFNLGLCGTKLGIVKLILTKKKKKKKKEENKKHENTHTHTKKNNNKKQKQKKKHSGLHYLLIWLLEYIHVG